MFYRLPPAMEVFFMSRLETMAKRIAEDLPEFVELIPPSEISEGMYRRIRHIQKTGECCGFPMSMEQLKEIIALASAESVHKPLHFLCRVLDRLHIERTLKTATNRLNIDERIRNIGHYITFEARWQIKYLSDLITGKYSMDDLMVATEIAMKKQKPARYLLTMFRNGFDQKKMYCYNSRKSG